MERGGGSLGECGGRGWDEYKVDSKFLHIK